MRDLPESAVLVTTWWVRRHSGIFFPTEVPALLFLEDGQLGQHQMTIKFMDNSIAGRHKAFTYQVSCPAVQAGAAQEHPGSTLCMKDFMSVSREADSFSHSPCRRVWCLDSQAEEQGQNCDPVFTSYWLCGFELIF